MFLTLHCLCFLPSPGFLPPSPACRLGKRAVLADRTGAAAKKWARWLPICYALFAGVLGTQSVLYGKTMSMLLRTTFSGDSQLVSWDRAGQGRAGRRLHGRQAGRLRGFCWRCLLDGIHS